MRSGGGFPTSARRHRFLEGGREARYIAAATSAAGFVGSALRYGALPRAAAGGIISAEARMSSMPTWKR
jgi:hypothetical protein